ncbi:hypothetical protein OPQ81_009543 [Rhizoctonia solani]|nr:hypothetical protein OPQ81_009543 [Rhizoctonia solani]
MFWRRATLGVWFSIISPNMEHNEDEQPNESIYGRRKHIPFVKNTSRIQGQQKHQYAPNTFSAPHGESSRGRGYVRGRGRDHSRGRGQGKHRSEGGRNPPPHVPQLPLFKQVDCWTQFDALKEHNQHTIPESSTWLQPNFGVRLGASPSHLPLEKPDEWAPGPSVIDRQPPIPPSQNSRRPRKRFRPGKNGKHKHNSQHNTTDANTLTTSPSLDRQAPLETADPLRADDYYPPSKRPRIKEEEASPSRTSLSESAQGEFIKSEMGDDPGIDLLLEKSTSGTKFISYDNHPMCRFNCGEPPSRVRKYRKALKGQEVEALRNQGKEVLTAFIRDDGIAIDWVVPNKSDVDSSIPKNTPPTVILGDSGPDPTPPSEGVDAPTLPSLNRPLPSHLNPLVASADKPDCRRSSTCAATTTEIAYREVPIPSRHLPRDGNTRKLEIWALEQMRLLEAELGPVIIPPPELVGIGECITGQKLPEVVHPHIKIRYRQIVRVHQPSVKPGTDFKTPKPTEPVGKPAAISPIDLSTAPLPPIDVSEPTLPEIAHPEAARSPSIPITLLPIKNDLDELADDPLSVATSPEPTHSTAENTHTPVLGIKLLNEKTVNEPCTGANKEPLQTADEDANRDSDELQRLRRDLELSRLEAERKHRELEQRILELSQKRLGTHTPTPNIEPTPKPVRTADEASESTILHVSWLGVMQLVDRDSRRIVATGFESGVPSSISIEDACSLASSSTALALSGSECQLAIAALGEGSFSFLPLRDQPHDDRGICSVVPVDARSTITLGHDHRYVHWKFQQDQCSTDLLCLPKLHSFDSKQIPNTVELSNHPHHVHIDPDNSFLLILELARLDDQFQVHDIRMPLYQCVQKFGYQNVLHEKAEFRVRGSSKGNYFARGDTGIVRLWDRRSSKSHQTIHVIPHQRVVDVVLDYTSISCATEAHHIVTYPIL